MINVVVPELGEGITKATIACWHAKAGEQVSQGDDLVELVTDKAVFNVSADTSGILKEIYYAQGQEVSIGTNLARIE